MKGFWGFSVLLDLVLFNCSLKIPKRYIEIYIIKYNVYICGRVCEKEPLCEKIDFLSVVNNQ